MDDYKRTLYMQARNYLEQYPEYQYGICNCLANALHDEGQSPSRVYLHMHLGDIFPELYALYDGVRYTKKHKRRATSRYGYWWRRKDTVARIRALDYILRE